MTQREASIEDQVRLCSAFIERSGGVVRDELVFFDRAVSGASLERPGFQRMMSLVNARPKKVDTIVTEDLSRITRDLADGAAIFKRLQYLEVALIGVSDGIDTSASGAKMAFGLKALMSDSYLEELRAKTLRGLEGRALAGLSTGGLPIGYRSQAVLDGLNRVVGHRIVVDEASAQVVRRIFSLYVDGASIAGIARRLNEERLPPPRAKTLHRRKGWVASTVRDILHNRTYVGERSFKKKQWIKVPDTNVRRYRRRPERDVIRRERPELRIVDADLWEAAQSRLTKVRAFYTKSSDGSPKGRGSSGKLTSYPLSGLLHCAECGTSMTIYGGSSYKYYRCGDFKKRGTCRNGLTLREDIARTHLLQFLRENLASPAAVQFIRKTAAEILGQLSRTVGQELAERRQRLCRTEERIAGLVHFIAEGDHSEYVRQALLDLEAQARLEKDAIEACVRRSQTAVRLPSPEETAERALRFEDVLLKDPARGREELRRLFDGGRVMLRPQAQGFYLAQGKLLPLALFSLRLDETNEGSLAPNGARPLSHRSHRELEFSCSSHGCAGPQRDLSAPEIPGDSDWWVPFEGSIAIGWE